MLLVLNHQIKILLQQYEPDFFCFKQARAFFSRQLRTQTNLYIYISSVEWYSYINEAKFSNSEVTYFMPALPILTLLPALHMVFWSRKCTFRCSVGNNFTSKLHLSLCRNSEFCHILYFLKVSKGYDFVKV